jgi:inward rectifier potassium channel
MADIQIRERLNGIVAPLRAAVKPSAPRERVTSGLGGRKVIAAGLENNLWTDFYHNAMTATWPMFFGVLAASFLCLNLVFASIYMLGGEPIANARPGSFWDLFFFSVETTSTVGYGDMHPQTIYGHSVATVENFVGMVLLAVMTGLVFARFSRPRARLIFARNPVVTIHNGVPTLKFRLANARNNFITEANAKLWVLAGNVTTEGVRLVGFKPLRLLKSENPVFALSWTLFHPIDERSQLFGLGAEEIEASEMNFVVSITGLDETSSQIVHARYTFAAQDVRFGHEFVDIHSVDEDGSRRVDYSKIHDTRPLSLQPAGGMDLIGSSLGERSDRS